MGISERLRTRSSVSPEWMLLLDAADHVDKLKNERDEARTLIEAMVAEAWAEYQSRSWDTAFPLPVNRSVEVAKEYLRQLNEE